MINRRYEVIVVDSLTRSLRQILLRTFLLHDTRLYHTSLISAYVLYRASTFEKFVKHVTTYYNYFNPRSLKSIHP